MVRSFEGLSQMLALAIHSLYLATEGEGFFVGTPQVFVRIQGCAIGCSNCDSKSTWSFSHEEDLWPLEQVLNEVDEITQKGKGRGNRRVGRVSITGGDPLHPQFLAGTLALAGELKKRDYFVNVEASGVRIFHELFDLVDFISFDYKTPSTGVLTPPQHILLMARQYGGKFQVKAVVETREDFEDVLRVYRWVEKSLSAESRSVAAFPWFLTPTYNLGEDFPRERFLNVVRWNEEEGEGAFRVLGQQHKWYHGPDKEGV